MTSWEFPGAEPIDIYINIASGSVAISGEATAATTVELDATRPGRDGDLLVSETQVSFTDGRLEIVQPRMSGFLRLGTSGLDLTVKAPPGSRCVVETASADVACMGELAELRAKTASGDVTAATVTGALDVTTASGDVWLDEAGAAARLNTASGDIRLHQAGGDVTVKTASGKVSIGTAAGSVHAITASGDIRIHSVARGEAGLKTVSGSTTVGVAAGADVYLDLSSLTGRISSQLDETDGAGGAGLRLSCRSVSGDIRVVRTEASSAPAA